MKGLASADMSLPKRITFSAKIDEETAIKLRKFVRDNAGKPNYYSISSFLEQAILSHLDACEARAEEDLTRNQPPMQANGQALLNNRKLRKWTPSCP
jgi:hypothetical protein